MNRHLLALALLVALTVIVAGFGCDSGKTTGDSAAIRDTIHGYVDAYNAEDYEKCLSYLTGWGPSYSRDSAISLIRVARESTGRMTIEKIEDITVSGSTATAVVTSSWEIPDAEGNCTNAPGEEVSFRKEGDAWKYVV